MHAHHTTADATLPDIPLQAHQLIAEQSDREAAAERRRLTWRRRPSIRTTVFRPAYRARQVIA